MMKLLTFFTGTDVKRKRKTIEKEMLSASSDGKRVFLIVPEQAAFDRDRELLLRLGEKECSRLNISGLERFVTETLEEYGIVRKPFAENSARAAVMSLALDAVRESIEIFARHGARLSSVNELLSTYDEIKESGATPELLGKVPSGNVGRKARELSLIFSAYDTLINERFADPTDNITRLCEYLPGKGLFENTVFFFDDFRGFTCSQIRLIGELAAEAENVFLSVTAPDFNENDGNEAFRHSRRNARLIRRRAAEKNVKCYEKNTDGDKNGEDIFAFLRDNLFSESDDSIKGKVDNVCIYKASDIEDECSFVTMTIKKLLESGKYRCRDIGIFQRSGNYTESLTAMLKKCGIPVFEDTRKPLGDYPLVRMLLSGTEAAAKGINTQRIFTYLKTGVAGVTDEECDLLENYVTLWSIDGKAWEKDFSGNPDGYGVDFDDVRRNELEKINVIRRKAAEPVLKLRAALSDGEPLKSCTAVYELIDDTGAKGEFLRLATELSGAGAEKEALDCARVWDETADALDALYNSLGKEYVSPLRFYELLTLILCGDSLGDIPAGIDRIVMGTADRTRFLDPKIVFMTGVCEGDFPINSVRNGIFGTEEKRELAKYGIAVESIPENIYSEERLIAYNCVTAASDRLYVSYPSVSVEGDTKAPSEIISELSVRLPGLNVISVSDTDEKERVFSPYSALELFASRLGSNDAFTASLEKALESVPGFKEKTRAVRYAHDGTPAGFSDKKLSAELFGKRLYVSPSRLESFSKCPFMYFCRYGMKAKPIEPAKLDSRINGLLVHRVFEVLLGKYSKQELTKLSYDARKKAVDETADEYINTNMGGSDGMSTAVKRQTERQKEIILDILNRLISGFDMSEFEVSDVELEIKRGADAEPYTVKSGDIEVTLYGTVDRVDTFRDGDTLYFRVIDYKTGGKKFVLSDVFGGLNMQMLIYMIALWLNGKGKYANALPAGILYVPARSSGANVDRNADREQIEKQKLINGRMNGIILENETVLRGMESEAAGIFIEQRIKDGRMEGELYSMEDIGRIRKKIEEVITEEVQRMTDGDVSACPVLDGDYKTTCEYCRYASVCRRETDGAKRDYFKTSFKNAIKMLKEEADK